MRTTKNQKPFLLFVGIIVVLALSQTPDTSAFWPPLQNVEVTVDYGARPEERDRICYKVYDPVRRSQNSDCSDYTDNITGPLNHHGVVAWLETSRAANPRDRVCAAVYDPAVGSWRDYTSQETSREWSENISDYRNQDGVVAWLEQGGGANSRERVCAAVYDPAAGSWRASYNWQSDWLDNVVCWENQDGVVAWQEESGSNCRACFTLYDPVWQSWKLGCTEEWSNGTQSLSITNGTVHYGSNTWGYDHDTARWSRGTTTQPLAHFSTSRTSGLPPLSVWFIDMSIAGTSWNWDFGDGGGSTERSNYYTFGTCGIFTVKQTVSGDGATNSVEASVETDSAPPTGTITINNGNPATPSNSVALTLSATDNCSEVVSLQLKNEGLPWSDWQDYTTTMNWTLTPGEGHRTVFARFRDVASHVSDEASDSICLDQTPPVGSITINSGAEETVSRSVMLTLPVSDTPYCGLLSRMKLSNDGMLWSPWEVHQTTKAWTLTPGYEQKTVYAQFRDAAGNLSPQTSDSIIFTPIIDGNILATSRDRRVFLGWSGFQFAGAISTYTLSYSVSGTPSTQIYSGTDTCYTHSGLTNGTTYNYIVRATDDAGNISEGATASATPREKLIGVARLCPAGDCAPQMVVVDPVTGTGNPLAVCEPESGFPDFGDGYIYQGGSSIDYKRKLYFFATKNRLFAVDTETGGVVKGPSFDAYFHSIELERETGDIFAIVKQNGNPVLVRAKRSENWQILHSVLPISGTEFKAILPGISAFDPIGHHYFFVISHPAESTTPFRPRRWILHSVNTEKKAVERITLPDRVKDFFLSSISSLEFDPSNRTLCAIVHSHAGGHSALLCFDMSKDLRQRSILFKGYCGGVSGISGFKKHRYFFMLKSCSQQGIDPLVKSLIVDTQRMTIVNTFTPHFKILSLEYE